MVEASENNRLFHETEAANNAIKYKNKKLIADKLSDLFDENATMFRMGSRVDARMAQVASELDARELSPEQRAVADVFGGKADNLTIFVKTKEGNERKVVMRQGNDLAGAKHSLYAHYGTTKGVINADDLLLIPDVIANGERTENGKKAVYKLDVNVSDGELRYMLWKSYNRLQRGPIAEIEDIAMEDKTNTGDRANRFREVANDGISNRYDQRVA